VVESAREFTNVLNSMACELAMRKCEKNLEVKRQAIFKERGDAASSSQGRPPHLIQVEPPGSSQNKRPCTRVDDVLARLAGSTARLGVSPQALFDRVATPGSETLGRAQFDKFILSFQADLTSLERHLLFERFCSQGSEHIERLDFCRTLSSSIKETRGELQNRHVV